MKSMRSLAVDGNDHTNPCLKKSPLIFNGFISTHKNYQVAPMITNTRIDDKRREEGKSERKKDLALVPTVLGDCALGSKFKKIDIPAKIAMVNGLTLVKVLLTHLKRLQVRAC